MTSDLPGGVPVLVIVGPTGSGKTPLALELARRLNAEVISADSRQVYRQIQAGTAKPSGTWQSTPAGNRYVVEGVVHHLLDHVDVDEIFHAGRFVREAGEIIQGLAFRSVPAVVVGGTGMYLRALVRGLAPLPQGDHALRRQWTETAAQRGRDYLHTQLARMDPVAAQAIPAHNIQRVIRALEVFALTGTPLSQWQKTKTVPSPWKYQWHGICFFDGELYAERLKQRCEAMEPGIIEEVSRLRGAGVLDSAPGLQSLGYREALAYRAGKTSREEFGKELVMKTRQYAKRQMTWFRAEPVSQWWDAVQPLSYTADKIITRLSEPGVPNDV